MVFTVPTKCFLLPRQSDGTRVVNVIKSGSDELKGGWKQNLEVASLNSFRDIKKNHFVTAAADTDDSIKRKRIRISLKKNQLDK